MSLSLSAAKSLTLAFAILLGCAVSGDAGQFPRHQVIIEAASQELASDPLGSIPGNSELGALDQVPTIAKRVAKDRNSSIGFLPGIFLEKDPA